MNSTGIPFLTHSWIAAADTVAPSVEKITRSSSKKGRSKMTSPLLLTTRRSLFLEIETPKPSTNTSPKTLSAGSMSLPSEGLFQRVRTESVRLEACVGLFVLLECFLQKRDELAFQFGTTEDLGIRAE